MSSDIEQPENITQRFGARVVQMNDGTILVQQTVKSGPRQNDRYVIDSATGKNERFVNANDDNETLGRAVREALAGQLR